MVQSAKQKRAAVIERMQSSESSIGRNPPIPDLPHSLELKAISSLASRKIPWNCLLNLQGRIETRPEPKEVRA